MREVAAAASPSVIVSVVPWAEHKAAGPSSAAELGLKALAQANSASSAAALRAMATCSTTQLVSCTADANALLCLMTCRPCARACHLCSIIAESGREHQPLRWLAQAAALLHEDAVCGITEDLEAGAGALAHQAARALVGLAKVTRLDLAVDLQCR